MPGLDGLRALAVLGVLAFHAGLPWAQGGFLGVDAFFVLSGYLITSLLLVEWCSRGSISLGAFWARRARRLLPALFVLLGAVGAFAYFLAPADTLQQLRMDALATFGYVANWHEIATGHGYFTQQALPSPLLHTWSLAIEEQFYVLWPLVVLGLLRWRRSRRAVLVVAALGAVGSAAEMAVLYGSGGNLARVYYGTDTRAQSLLVGAALAVLLSRREKIEGRAGGSALTIVAIAGAVACGWAWSHLDGQNARLYRGGYLVLALAVAAVIACLALVPRGPLARLCSLGPLRYTGRISYGIYLWHWPVFLVLDRARTGLAGPGLLWSRLATTFVLAALSYHLVEMPVRRGALRRIPRWSLPPLAAGTGTLAVALATIAYAPASAPALAAPSPSSSSALSTKVTTTPWGVDPSAPHKVVLVGDSVALTLGQGLAVGEARWGVDVVNDGMLGCGLATSGPYEDRGTLVAEDPSCDTWPERWRAEIERVRPEVAALVTGRWEVVDRVINGQLTHVGTPAFDSYLSAQLEEAVQVLGTDGTRVVLFTSPYFSGPEQPDGNPWPQDDPSRVDRLNQLIRQVAARNPGRVTVMPLGALLSPGGRYAGEIDHIQVRASDGVHISVLGGMWLAPKILPQLVHVGSTATPGPPGERPA